MSDNNEELNSPRLNIPEIVNPKAAPAMAIGTLHADAAGETPLPTDQRLGQQIIDGIQALLGERATLVPYHHRTKKAVFRAHQKANLSVMEHPDYIATFGRYDRNAAVLLGHPSNGLVTLDFDKNEHADTFLEKNPKFRETLTTKASRGCNLWFYADGELPSSFDLKDDDGGNIVELRASKRLTLIHGKHPSGQKYRVVVSAKPIRIRIKDIVWPNEWVRKSGNRLGAAECAEIAVVGDAYADLVRQHGAPVLIGENRSVFINQVAVAVKFLIENPVKYFKGLGFYKYDQNTGIWTHQTRDWVKKQLSDDLAHYSCQTDAQGVLFIRTDRLLTEIVNLIAAYGEQEFEGVCNGRFIHLVNGMFDVEQGELLPFSPDFMSLAQLQVAYEPAAFCARFLAFLQGALPRHDIVLLQKWCGLALSGVNFAQSILLITGVAGAGKGVFVNVMCQIIGQRNCVQLRTLHLENRFETARFFGKSLLVGSDVRNDFLALKGADTLKALSGGDMLTAELKGQNECVQLKGTFNIVATSNRRLRVTLDGDHDAWARRLKIVEFTKKAQRQNPNLAKELFAQEASGILNWMLEGLAALRSDFNEHGGWRLHSVQIDRVESLLMESNSLSAFVGCDVEEGNAVSNVTVRELVTAYDAYCEDRNWTPQTHHTVERELPNILRDKFGVSRRNDVMRNGLQQRGWCGIRLVRPAAGEKENGEANYVGDLE